MKITVLDAETLGKDLSLEPLKTAGETTIYNYSAPDEIAERIADCEVIVINKIKLNSTNLPYAKRLRLICLAATGCDNVDLEYCRENNIAVCNVAGYSTNSVALLTATMALTLTTRLREYNDFVISGEYAKAGLPNRLTPTFHETDGMTWGIVGYGNIGKRVAEIARALGCDVIANKRTRTPVEGCELRPLDELMRRSDIISVHTPLNDGTRGLISADMIKLMKKSAILINVARGAVTDEAALALAVKEKRIGGIGVDVYSTEPFPESHPFNEIKDLPNVCLTPHSAWGAYEARVRCLDEIIENIKAFYKGEKRSRVDIL